LSPDFAEENCIREYMGLVRALNQNDTDSLNNLSYEEYRNNKVVIGLNFAPDLSNGLDEQGRRNKPSYGSLRIQLRFATPLAESITALVYGEFDSRIKIDKDRNIFTSYMS
jgi:hypothetical protein